MKKFSEWTQEDSEGYGLLLLGIGFVGMMIFGLTIKPPPKCVLLDLEDPIGGYDYYIGMATNSEPIHAVYGCVGNINDTK